MLVNLILGGASVHPHEGVDVLYEGGEVPQRRGHGASSGHRGGDLPGEYGPGLGTGYGSGTGYGFGPGGGTSFASGDGHGERFPRHRVF